MKLKAIIVEDDLMSSKSLRRLCSNVDAIDVIDDFTNPLRAIDFLKTNHVDLIFLDVEMPEISGLELLDRITKVPHVIITTSKEKYAFEAFEHNVVDFLKKPIPRARFDKAIQKLITIVETQKQTDNSATVTDIFLKIDGKIQKIPIDDILYFEKTGDYLKVILTNKTHVIYKTLKSLDNELTHSTFLKVHRSYLVNLSKIDDVNNNELTIGTKNIPISRAHKANLKTRLAVIR